jgi:predicted DNA-binding ribbon-helix-helix protein
MKIDEPMSAQNVKITMNNITGITTDYRATMFVIDDTKIVRPPYTASDNFKSCLRLMVQEYLMKGTALTSTADIWMNGYTAN